MQDQNKVYGPSAFIFMSLRSHYSGFTVSLLEYESTIPTLWSTVKRMYSLDKTIQSDSYMQDLLKNIPNFSHLTMRWIFFPTMVVLLIIGVTASRTAKLPLLGSNHNTSLE